MSEVTQPTKIVVGGDKEFEIDLRLENGRPFDLTGWTALKVRIKDLEISHVANANGSVVAIAGNVILGILKVTLKQDDTKAFEPDERVPLDWEVTLPTAIVRDRIPDAVNIVDNKITVV